MLDVFTDMNKLSLRLPGFPRLVENPGKSWIFPKLSRSWKVLENEFGPRKSWKLQFKVLESPGIYLCFKLYNRHSAEFGLLLTETQQEYFVHLFTHAVLSGKPNTFFSTGDECSAILLPHCIF